MNISPSVRFIRGSRISLALHGPVLHNRCVFDLNDDGVFTIRVPRSFFGKSNNLFRVVFVTSCNIGINYVGRDPTDFEIVNERVLGYVVCLSDGTMRVWTKPFDLSGNQHMHNFLFRDTIAFVHIPIGLDDHFYSEWELTRLNVATHCQSVLFKCGVY